MWRLNYEPGTLKAVSRRNGQTVLEKTINTAGEASKIVLEADRSSISADGKDLSFITAKVYDEAGNLVPNADNLIQFNITGNGFIAGVDNGYQASHEPFKANKRKAFKGMCLAIIQSNGETGNIQIEATSDGLKSSTITIEAK
jgi:beta-galactosidase